jgi:phage recombination protein Bet
MGVTTMNQLVPAIERPSQSLVVRIADRYGVEAERMLVTLKATAFKSDKPISNEQMMALLIVAEQYKLNPFTRELFAFPDKGGIVPVVSVDGWARIINEHPMLDGIDFDTDDPSACTAIIYRKDRAHPIRVTEYMSECKRGTGPWNSHPRRMLRHKALIQCARLAFGFAGIYDEDEAHRIVHPDRRDEAPSAGAARVRAVLAGGPPTTMVEEVAPAPASDDTTAAAPPASPIEPDDELLAKCMARVMGDDEDIAVLTLDEARDVLTEEQHAVLSSAFLNRWQLQGDK